MKKKISRNDQGQPEVYPNIRLLKKSDSSSQEVGRPLDSSMIGKLPEGIHVVPMVVLDPPQRIKRYPKARRR